ncbi:hypothetical protein HNR23_003769 [Nocardiopsis mwathae]|uniref:Holin n=1 Tax=Nocardiopsis mwathae TaxID=1472723 RepID=A0A7W9YK77_9ACTN|nr:hypothetical protein [Nocardiopsis mwathae]MBB6173709.1 hypothetical protein [Nocardiopsis mwathae]
MSTVGYRGDARRVALRSSVQALVVVALTGAGAAVSQLTGPADALTLETVMTTALAGAGYAVAAYVHKRLDGFVSVRRGSSQGEM